jgi:hypothetical protein
VLLPEEPGNLSLLTITLSQRLWPTVLVGLWPTALIVIMCVLIGAVAAVILVALAGKENRVDAIRATADLLSALLPWRPRRRTRGN